MDDLKEILIKMRSWIIVVVIGISFYEILEHLKIVWNGVMVVLSVFMPFVVGAALAWLLDIPVRKLEETKVMKRGLAIIFVLICVVLAFILLVEMVVPQLVLSVGSFMENVPTYINNVERFINKIPYLNALDINRTIFGDPKAIAEKGMELISDYGQNLLSYGMEVGSGLLSVITSIVFSVYVLIEKDHMVRQLKLLLKALFPKSVCNSMMHVYQLADKMMTSFLMGKMLDSLIIGILTAVLMGLLHIPFVSLISVLVGVTNIIPVFGPIIGGIIGAILILLAEPKYFIVFVILIIIIQQVDGHFIGPKILGDTVGLSTAWTLFAILIGGELFGFTGMILGVPVFAVVYSLIREFVYKKLKMEEVLQPCECGEVNHEALQENEINDDGM
ncbi:MAG: AI-2E family transporter [Lachnospiraceae bacterium]